VIRARPLEVPMAKPMRLAQGVMSSVPVVLIDLTTEDGVTGRSYLRTYTPRALRALTSLVEDLADVTEPPHTLKLLGTKGLVGAALAGLDMARWDIKAQEHNVPLATLLNAQRTAVPAYVSLRARDPREAAQEAQGHREVKLKLGGRPRHEDEAAIEAVKETGATVMGDYNQSLSVEEALTLDDLELAWIEEPTDAHDFEGHRRIADALRTPIQLGENLEGAAELKHALNASDLLMFDAMKIGGVSGWFEAIQLTGKPISSHTFPEYSVHLLAATPNAHRLEYLDHLAPIRATPLALEDGHVRVPDTPGVGLLWDERGIKRLAERH